MYFITKIKEKWLENSPVQHDAARRLYQDSTASQLAAFVLAILFGLAILKTTTMTASVYVWLALISVVYVVRDLMTIHYKRDNKTTANIVWLNRFRIATTISGFAWASSTILMFDSGDILNQAIILFTLTGICAAAALTYSIDYFALFGFLLPITIGIFIRLLIEGSEISIIMSLMVALFILFMIAIARKSNTEYKKNIMLASSALERENREKSYSQVMELIANNHPINDILDKIVSSLEINNPAMLCTILLLEPDGKHLKVVSAKSLPSFYNIAINGVEIGPQIGSCGSAAFSGNRVIAENIQNHPNWINYRDLAAKAGLGACWSEPIKDSTGKVLGTFAIYHHQPTTPTEKDINTIVQNASLASIAIELARNSQEQRLASLFYQSTNESMIITDKNNIIIAVNPAFTLDTGYSPEEAIGKNPSFLQSKRHDEAFYQALYEELNNTGSWQGEIWNRRKNGEIYVEFIRINTIYDGNGEILNRVSLATDVTAKKESEETIWKQANYDELTGLPNRRMFHDRFHQEIKKTKRSKLPLALLYIDLDEFKEVNDVLGHYVGDILLIETAERLTSCVRESDTVAQLSSIARLGGDEFTIVLSEIKDISCIERIAQSILARLSEPYQLNQDTAYISASIGITIYPDDADNIETLMRNADQAMYAAKREGKNRFSYFTKSMQDKVEKRMEVIRDLHHAVKNHEFHLVYQPIINLRNNKTLKAEALIRWQHPTKGLISPADFIPIAENSGLIFEIGNWVFLEALQQVVKWRESIDANFQISINKSPVQIQGVAHSGGENHLNWPAYVRQIGLPGDALTVEITEGLLLDSNEGIHKHLLDFRDAGIQVALDDFGTGYSSLSYLKKFDIDYIKIDQSFVQNIEHDSDSMVLCQAIIVMAHKLKLKVIAEGIETKKQLELLKFAGCDFGQGYFLSKPLSVKDFEDFVSQTEVKTEEESVSG
jgi:diguanylate cyclase (GGDEF)-like protein/PAS domain S-box-containing protein